MADDRALAFARELEREDERLATGIGEVTALAVEVEAVRDRAVAVTELLEALPVERERAGAAVQEAEQEAARRREEAERAREELARAEERPDEREALAAARRAATRTADALSMGEKRLARAREVAEAVEREAAAAELEAPELERRSLELAGRLARVPRLSRAGLTEPGDSLAAVAEWGARARAALLVVRGGLETERERVVRQANELYASVAGEAAYGSSVAQVRERLERVG